MRFKSLALWSLLCLLGINASSVQASELFTTARVKARGNTYVGQFYSNQVARFNPAVLAEALGAFQFRPLELNATVGENVLSTISDIVDHDFSSNNSDAVIDFIRKFQDKFGQRHFGSLEAEILAFRIMQFDVTPFFSNKSYIELRRPTIPKFDFALDTLAGINLAYGHSFSGNFKVGAAVRPTFRTTTEGNLTFTDILDLENSNVEEIADTDQGMGVGVDLSAIWNPSINFRLGATVQNIGGMGYLSGDDTPAILLQRSSIGGLYRLPIDRWELNLTMDIQGLENSDGIHWSRLIHLGGEFGTKFFTKDLDYGISAGVNDGYFSYGAFAEAWLFRLEIAKYWEELDRNPGSRGDERIAISLSTAMTF